MCGGTSANVVRYNVMGNIGEISDVFTVSVIVLEDSANVIRYDATRFLGECSDVFTLSVMCEELQLMELAMLQLRYMYYVQGNYLSGDM